MSKKDWRLQYRLQYLQIFYHCWQSSLGVLKICWCSASHCGHNRARVQMSPSYHLSFFKHWQVSCDYVKCPCDVFMIVSLWIMHILNTTITAHWGDNMATHHHGLTAIEICYGSARESSVITRSSVRQRDIVISMSVHVPVCCTQELHCVSKRALFGFYHNFGK